MRTKIQTKTGHKIINLNRRKAIREKCLNCAGWSSYKDVADCEFENCDLYPFRFGTGKQNAQDRHDAIRKFCLNCCVGNQYEVYNCPATDCPLYSYRKVKIDYSVRINSKQKIGYMRLSLGIISDTGIS